MRVHVKALEHLCDQLTLGDSQDRSVKLGVELGKTAIDQSMPGFRWCLHRLGQPAQLPFTVLTHQGRGSLSRMALKEPSRREHLAYAGPGWEQGGGIADQMSLRDEPVGL